MEKHYSTSSPDRVWDYVVIGSGMGGMACGALLARLGKRVLLLEQHYVPGGFTQTFKRRHWVWDVGVHAVGEVSEKAVVGRVMHKLTNGNLEWEPLSSVYDEFYFPDDFRIGFPSDRLALMDALGAAFPAERGAIAQYMSQVAEVSEALQPYFLSRIFSGPLSRATDLLLARKGERFLRQRTGDNLQRITSNERLRTVLAAQWGYYGTPPSRSSWGIHAAAAKHFWHGGHYPRGGARSIADSMLATIAASDGWTRIRAAVDEILVKSDRAIGVRLDTGEEIRAKAVVSATGAHTTVSKLLPDRQRNAPWAKSIGALASSPAYVCLHLGFKGDIRKAGAGAANKWFYRTWDNEASSWNFSRNEEAPVLYTSFPSLKNPQHDPGPDQLHTGEIVTFVPYGDFARWRDARWMKRGQEYMDLKEKLSEQLLGALLKQMPDLAPMVAYTELSTPVSTEHFTCATRGAIYGLESTPERYSNPWLRPRTPVKNLYMAGVDVASCGVVGAFVGGLLCATSAEPIGAMRFLRGM